MASDRSECSFISFPQYELFHLCLHRSLCPADSKWELSDGRALARRNWNADSNGAAYMDRSKFEHSLTQVSRHWAEDIGSTRVAVGVHLLAAEAGLPRDLPTVFLACLTKLLVTEEQAPHLPPALQPWFRIGMGCCSGLGVQVMRLLGSMAEERARELELAGRRRTASVPPPGARCELEAGSTAAGSGNPSGNGPSVNDCKARPGSGSGSGGLDLGLDCGPGATALARFALHRRMARLLDVRRAAPAPYDHGQAPAAQASDREQPQLQPQRPLHRSRSVPNIAVSSGHPRAGVCH
eukprot:tig00020902_g14956.t1